MDKTVEIKDDLVREVMELTGAASEREAIERSRVLCSAAPEEHVRLGRRSPLARRLRLQGPASWQ
jgi:hypothetical protein